MEGHQFAISNEPVYLKINKEEFDALIYTVMLDEIKRLRNAKKIEERREIRQFILESYQAFVKCSREDKCQDRVPINTQTQN